MRSLLISLYVIVACIFFCVGKVTTEQEVRNSFLAALASSLWPLACIAVAVCVIYEKRKGNVARAYTHSPERRSSSI